MEKPFSAFACMYTQRESHYGKAKGRKKAKEGKPFLTFPERLSVVALLFPVSAFRMSTFLMIHLAKGFPFPDAMLAR